MLNLFKKEINVKLLAPMTGEIIELEDVPDEVFASKMIGDGLAIKPSDNEILSPCDGKIVQIFPTKHAIGIETNEGLEILIHIGIDTVVLNGNGFKSFVSQGDRVYCGDKLLEVDLDYINKNAKSTITPILITNMDKVKEFSKINGDVKKNKDVIMEIKM
ncbi:PTS sugar transporter subunit IIA [Paratissierella segnis]|uniref:PTS glucose transporter subunit IIA n=1 Tax=Paratissierella segnis TaxID=2763679 RepID=A0A926EUB7_9FIRM|nr:PTS glucose transporter subunit IIA [Paratissierella segnis]MBC8589046.1 PTS glucose transporter subunit IIA [Paratissierella segnis]